MKIEDKNRYKDVPKDPNWELPKTTNYQGKIIPNTEGIDKFTNQWAEAPFRYKDFHRVLRGGGIGSSKSYPLRSAFRFNYNSTYSHDSLGFRLLLQKKKP